MISLAPRARIVLVVLAALLVIAAGIRLASDRTAPRAAPAVSAPDDSNVPVARSAPPMPGDNLRQMHDVDVEINVLQATNSAPQLVRAAEMALGVGDLWRAEALLKSALARQPTDHHAKNRLADVLNQQERTAEARQICMRLSREDPKDLAPYLTLQSIAEREKKQSESSEWLARAASQCAQTAENYIAIAHRYYSVNDIPAARRTMARGGVLAPADINMQLQTAILLFQRAQLEESRAILESILQANPDNEPALRLLAGILLTASYKRRDLTRANSLLERAVALDPKDANVYRLAASVYKSMRLYRMAAEAYVAYLTLEPRNPGARYGLGQVYQQLGMADLAKEQFAISRLIRDREERIAPLSSLVSEKPFSAETHKSLAVALERDGDYAGALREWQISCGLAPTDRAAASKLAGLYRRLGWPQPDRVRP